MSDGDEKAGERLIAGRYRLLSVVGQGGMGTVWRARDEMLDRDVAVKEVLVHRELSDAERDTMHERTLREARATARLNHSGIVTVHDVVDEGDRPWIVMEYLRARSLQEVIDDGDPLPPERVARIGGQMLGALRAAHAIGILHRDVKPANVLIADDGGRAVLTDFGIAQATGETSLTMTGGLVGSPAYIPPERARGERAVPASDLWALGATLYAACEGKPPHRRGDAVAVLAAIMTEEPPAPRNAGPLGPVLWGLLDKDPARRMTAEQAEEALERIARGAATAPQAAGGTAGGTHGDASGIPAGAIVPGMAPPAGPEGSTARFAQPPQPPGPAGPPVPPGTAGPPWTSYDPLAMTGQRPAHGRGANATLLVAVGVLATVVIMLVGFLVFRPGGGGSPNPKKTAEAARPQGDGTQNAGTPSSSPTPSDDGGDSGDSGSTVPPGLRAASGPGYSISVPAGWTRSAEGNSVFWRESSSGAYVQVDRTGWSGDPHDHWLQWEREVKAKGTLPGYSRIDLSRASGVPYDAADMEFTWQGADGRQRHGIDRGVNSGGRAYAVFVAVPSYRWEQEREKVNNVLGSFRPS